jgi:hypothetical protein
VRRGAWIVAALALGVAAWRELVLRGIAQPPIPGPREFRTDLRFDALLWGAAIALALRSDRARALATKLLSWPVWMAACVTFVGASLVPFRGAVPMLAVSAPILVVATALHPQWIASRALEAAPVRWIGRLSYSLYLFQQAFVAAPIPIPHAQWLVLPVACLSYYAVEKPMIRAGRALLAGRPAPARWALAFAVPTIAFVVWVGWPRDLVVHGPRAIIYADTQLLGRRRELALGDYDLSSSRVFENDTVSSLQVGTGASVRMCDDVANGIPGGKCVELPPGSVVMDVGEFNDRASFVEVRAAR